MEKGHDGRWTKDEYKQFENGLARFPDGCPDRWERVAARMGTRSAAEVEGYYAFLLADVADIEPAGLIHELIPECTKKKTGGRAAATEDVRDEKEMEKGHDGRWTSEEYKQFENGLVRFPDDCPDRWERIAAGMGTRSAAEVEGYCAVLLADVADNEATGLIHELIPEYTKKKTGGRAAATEDVRDEKEMEKGHDGRWTKDEYKQFENGLARFPDGCWDRWERVAARMGTRSAAEVEGYYAFLVADVADIEPAGLIHELIPECTKKKTGGSAAATEDDVRDEK